MFAYNGQREVYPSEWHQYLEIIRRLNVKGGVHLTDINGIEIFAEELHGFLLTTTHVRTEQAAKQVKRAVGSYITIETGEKLTEHTRIEEVGECLAEVLDQVLKPYHGGTLCVCGIGNKYEPADALGPETVRNLPLYLLSALGGESAFHNVCSIVPGTMMTNNTYTEVIVQGVAKEVGADCLLLVDSMVSDDPSRLFRTIQLSTNGGISSLLSGRKSDWSALGIPVISLGVPVTIPLSALAPNQELEGEMLTSMYVQNVIDATGRIIAYAILRVCWPSLSKSDCFVYSGLNKNPIPYSLLEEEAATTGPA